MAKYIDVDLAIELHNGKLWAWDVYDLEPFLDDVPAADVVEVRHGEWRYEGDYKACSLCGTFVEWNTLGTSHWKYCPFCGAKMDGKGEGE